MCLFAANKNKATLIKNVVTNDYVDIDSKKLTPEELQLAKIVKVLGPLNNEQTCFITDKVAKNFCLGLDTSGKSLDKKFKGHSPDLV
jgi:hypothetical protein